MTFSHNSYIFFSPNSHFLVNFWVFSLNLPTFSCKIKIKILKMLWTFSCTLETSHTFPSLKKITFFSEIKYFFPHFTTFFSKFYNIFLTRFSGKILNVLSIPLLSPQFHIFPHFKTFFLIISKFFPWILNRFSLMILGLLFW